MSDTLGRVPSSNTPRLVLQQKGRKEKKVKDGQQEQREGKRRNKRKAEKERAHRARKAVNEKKSCFTARQARNGSDSLSCRAKMPQTKWEIARVAYHDFHSRKHFCIWDACRGGRNPSDICMP